MSDHPLVYDIEVGSFAFRVREIAGTEQLSRTFRLDAHFALDPQTMRGEPADFDPDEVIKEVATVVMRRGTEEVRRIQGVVTEVELSATVSGVPQVEMVIEPRFALLEHRRDIRSHRNLTAPQIVTEVAEALGVKVDARLRESYPVRPYSVQWRESDYDYCNRLLEDEGIFYYFTEGDVLVLGDSPAAYEDVPGDVSLPFRHQAGANLNRDAVHAIGSRAAITPGRVTLRDWNTEHPSLDMDVSHATAVDFGPEWYDYPGEYEEPSEGGRKARLHAEAFDREAASMTGRSTCGRLFPGCVFELTEPPLGVDGGRHVVRRIDHHWSDETAGFESAFEADPEAVTYRPPRHTHVPRIFNPHTGIVCTNGEDIQCDHFGRVKVHFHWDRLRPYDDDCSHWISSLQDNTGGSSAIPRKDWEMVVHYLEGDPDRPIVVGRVFNGDDVFREKLPHAKDRSSLTSATSPSRDSANEMRFEDAAGIERIFLRAPKDLNINVANDQTQTVGNNNTWVVENDETVDVSGNADWEIGARCEPSIQNNQSWEVGGDRSKKIGKGDNNAVGGDHQLKIGGNQEITVYTDLNTTADNLEEKVTGNVTEKYKEKLSLEVGEDMQLTISGSYTQTVKGDKTEATVQDRKETITASHTITCGDETQMRVDKDRKSTIGGGLKISCKEILTLTGAERIETQSKTALWKGDVDLMLIVRETDGAGKGTYITFKDGAIEMWAPKNIVINISGSANHDSGQAAMN